jgi:hypothetical protein
MGRGASRGSPRPPPQQRPRPPLQIDKNVEREIINHRRLNNINVIGFKEVGFTRAALLQTTHPGAWRHLATPCCCSASQPASRPAPPPAQCALTAVHSLPIRLGGGQPDAAAAPSAGAAYHPRQHPQKTG